MNSLSSFRSKRAAKVILFFFPANVFWENIDFFIHNTKSVLQESGNEKLFSLNLRTFRFKRTAKV
jgi:hypothetical protein